MSALASAATRLARRLRAKGSAVSRHILGRALEPLRANRGPRIQRAAANVATPVEAFWTEYTVNSAPFVTARQSARYLEWRFGEYPLFRELSGLYGSHDGNTVLDYGCGPGNDLVGFAIHTNAQRIIGVDVSSTALSLARKRLALHGEGDDRMDLIKISDDDPRLPLGDASVDFVSSQGVIHHASHPEAVLCELFRVLKPGGTSSVMVYNRESIFFHLHVAWKRQVVEGAWSNMTAEEAFQRETDRHDCPISRPYERHSFVDLCERAGFEAAFLGGYLSQTELELVASSLEEAKGDERLGAEHRAFLSELEFDEGGLPLHRGWYAGFGGVYRLRKEG